MSLERTLLLVKPDAVAAGNVEPILQAIDSAGFFLCKRKRRKLSDAEARRLYAAQRGQRHFDNLIAFMTSGESEICELSGVGAVDRLLQLVGPPSVAVARKIASTTFRARYGTSATKNAVHGSATLEEAAAELALLLPQRDLSVMSTTEYLTSTVLPAVNGALEAVAKVRPLRPHDFIASWIEMHKPLGDVSAKQRSRPSIARVHSQSMDVLKIVDHFGIHNRKKLGIPFRRGIWGYRRVRFAPIIGAGIQHDDGLCVLVDELTKEGFKRLLFLNSMDEPCISVNGKAVVSRQKRKLNTRRRIKINDPTGRDLAMIEERLKADVQEECTKKLNTIEVFSESDETGRSISKSTSIKTATAAEGAGESGAAASAADGERRGPLAPLQTMRERYTRIKADFNFKHKVQIEYSRVPLSTSVAITPTHLSPILASLLSFARIDQRKGKDSVAIVCQCRAGTFRTVILMIVASLVWVHIRPESMPALSGDDYHLESPDLEKGQYPAMMELVDSLPRTKKTSGRNRKAVLDWVIDGCSKLMNIRATINTSKVAYEDSIVEESYGEETGEFLARARKEERTQNSRRAQLLLQDYMMLLLVEDYLHSNGYKSLSFSEWCKVERGQQVGMIAAAWVL